MLFAVCAPGIEPVLEAEVRALGLRGTAVAGGVDVQGGPTELMRLNLWSRTASRVLARMGEPFRATAFPELVHKASALPWDQFVGRGERVAFRVTCRKSRLYHSGAVEERLLAALSSRIAVKPARAAGDDDDSDAQLFVARIERDVCTVSADSSGALLHRRGWRGPQGKAPLRETLAAALLLAAGWSGETPLCDPLCGSGTIAIEAASLAMRRAPGISRSFAFQRWPGHSARQWEHLLADARKQERPLAVRIEASDQDAGAVAAARDNATRAGVVIEVAQRRLADLPPDTGRGLIACNPPYGVRVDPGRVFDDLGTAARSRPGWEVALIAADPTAARKAGLRLKELLKTQNGGIPVTFLSAARSMSVVRREPQT
ncbi:MAG: THUMP domain-containing class I SAM-dependent RNA methyltransferase [Deltaproteobacteria bacterium]